MQSTAEHDVNNRNAPIGKKSRCPRCAVAVQFEVAATSPTRHICHGCYLPLEVAGHRIVKALPFADVTGVLCAISGPPTPITGLSPRLLFLLAAASCHFDPSIVRVLVDGEPIQKYPKTRLPDDALSEMLITCLLGLDETTAWPAIRAVQQRIRDAATQRSDMVAPWQRIPAIAADIIDMRNYDRAVFDAGREEVERVFSRADGELSLPLTTRG